MGSNLVLVDDVIGIVFALGIGLLVLELAFL